ncbi:hypothetical protein E1A91_A05G234900v1 [Gossypium mustelinum]|uniref:CCHC-type domain-containing protein n=1 Tax=Gossypium mustelinum TaxID=34275 RepID=A0A5D2ZB62_GOSMU|nr:hypothetical protein E1A91_A05G234900v1 [Gossypium mustelinum]
MPKERTRRTFRKKKTNPEQNCWWRSDVKCNKCGRQGHLGRICKTQQLQEKTSATAEQYQGATVCCNMFCKQKHF